MGETGASREPGRQQPRMLLAAERELHAPAAAGVAGLVFAGLFVASVVLLYPEPARGGTSAQIAAWYMHGRVRTLAIVGLYLVPFAGIAFLWFVAAVHARIRASEDRFFATVFLGGGLLFVAMLARGLGYTLLYVYAIRAAAVFMVVSSTIGLRTGTLPRWLVFLGYAVALVLLLSVSYFKGFVLIFPAWVTLVSIELLRGARLGRA
jgi:hypothetical protein